MTLELSKALSLFLNWRLIDLTADTKNQLISIIEKNSAPEFVICLLNLIGGNNYKIFCAFCDENPEFEIVSHTDIEMLPKLNVALNSEQVAATLHDTVKRPLLILAGAGSGKTAVLTRRILFLILSGIPYDSIMAVTFTNKAADEMKSRLADIAVELAQSIDDPEYRAFLEKISSEYIPEMKVGTFHSICFDLLVEKISEIHNYQLLGYSSIPNILETIKQKGIVEKILLKNKITETIENILSDISSCKNELLSPEQIVNKKDLICSKNSVFTVFTEYKKILIKSNLIDFDDMIYYTVYLLQTQNQLAEYYQNKYRYFLIDEYQDTNYSQYIFALKMIESHKNIFAVGDDDQSIYGWRGADVGNILNFKSDFENALVVKFERNYRSSANILQAANNIFREKDASIRKRLKVSGNKSVGRSGLGEKIILYSAQDDSEEAEFCAHIILESVKLMRENSFNDSKKFILANNSFFYSAAENMLNAYNKITNYSLQLWTKTLEWVNIFNEISTADSLEKIHKFVRIYFEFQQIFQSQFSIDPEEKLLLTEFFEKLNELNHRLFKVSAVYRKFAVFYRINSQKEIFKEAFNKNSIQYIEVGNNQLFEYREIRNIIIMFKIITDYIQIKFLLNNPANFSALNSDISEIGALPKFKIQEKDKAVFEYSSESVYILNSDFIENIKNTVGPNARSYLTDLYDLCEKICFNYSKNTLNYVLHHILDFLDYNNMVYNNSVTGRQLKRNIDNFRLIMNDYERQYSKNNINLFYNFKKYIVYRSSDPQSSNSFIDGVYLMTLHSSKGLEFENVFFTGLEEDVCPYRWPGSNKIGDKELSEEKRLFYVGVTRAQTRLYLTYAQKRKWFGKEIKNKPSRFLKLIPGELLEK